MFCITGAALYIVNYGKIKIYMVLSLGMGFFVSRFLFEAYIKNAINKAARLIKSLKRRLINKRK